MDRPPALSDAQVIKVAKNVGGRYASDRYWLDGEDTIQEATAIAFELIKWYDPTKKKPDNDVSMWLGFWIKLRLHDWQRKSQQKYVGKANRDNSIFTEHLSLSELAVHPSYIDKGYWFIEELSTYKERMMTAHTPTLKTTPTNSQTKILSLYAEGKRIHAVAQALHCSPETVKSQLKDVRQRLFAKNTTHAVAIAIRRGLI